MNEIGTPIAPMPITRLMSEGQTFTEKTDVGTELILKVVYKEVLKNGTVVRSEVQ